MKHILYSFYYMDGDEKPRAVRKAAVFDTEYEAHKTATLLNTQTVKGEQYGSKPLYGGIKETIKALLSTNIKYL